MASHPRTRVTEAALDQQVLAVFRKMRIQDEAVQEWFRAVLKSQTKDSQQESLSKRAELQRQVTLSVAQQDKLINMRMADEIDAEVFGKKQTELRDRIADLKLQLDALDRSHDEWRSWRRKFLNSRKRLRTNGLQLITLRSAESSKSSFGTADSTT